MTLHKWLSLGGFLATMFAAPLVAQPLARQFSFNIGAGGAIPREDLTSFMNTSPMLAVGFGYRPFKYFQADVGERYLSCSKRSRFPGHDYRPAQDPR